MTELLKEIDGFRLSTFMHKDRGGKLVMGPLFDFNLSLGNADHLEGWQPAGWYYPLITRAQYMNGWYIRLFDDPEFKARYRERWWQLRRGRFSDNSLESRIDENALILSEAQGRNFIRWPVLNKYIWPNWYIAPTYDHEIAWMTDWLMLRTEWMDQQFGKPTTLVHFWNFNDLPEGDIYNLPADYSAANAWIAYAGTGDGYMDRVDDGTLLNADMGVPAGSALRVRNPSDSREMIFYLPTTGYRNVVFRYMAKRTPNGARQQTVYYRTNDLDGWNLCSDTLDITMHYQQFRFSFAGVENSDDNRQFSIRILFHGEEATGSSGNNRFDNITFEGYTIDEEENDSGFEAHVFHYNSHLYIDSPLEGTAHIEIFNLSGRMVARDKLEGRGLHNYPFSHPAGVYILKMVIGKHVFSKKFLVHK
jgi:hypothetical protein